MIAYKINALLKFIKEQVINHKEKSVLDVGCGNGRKTRIISKLFKKTTAIDRDLQILPESIKFFQRNMTDLNLDEKFDVIIAINSVHFNDPKTVLDGFKKVLNPGGIIIIQEPHIKPSSWMSDTLNKDSPNFDITRWKRKQSILKSEAKYLMTLKPIVIKKHRIYALSNV